MSEKYQFRAVIEPGDGGGAFVIVPFDVEKTFGKKRVKIHSHHRWSAIPRLSRPHGHSASHAAGAQGNP